MQWFLRQDDKAVISMIPSLDCLLRVDDTMDLVYFY